MARFHRDADLAPRDIVARSIMRESERTGGTVLLTLAHLDPTYVLGRFPTIADMCRRVGLDLARDPIPVGPAAHYIMGGVHTDCWGRTSCPGLYAAGEVACTGVHGANRLASNSLLEGLVFGARAATAMQSPPSACDFRRAIGWRLGGQPDLDALASSRRPLASEELRDLMWRSAGPFRTREDLRRAVAALDQGYAAAQSAVDLSPHAQGDDWRRFNLVTVARLIARAALRREESRGGHFRADFPERNDINWQVHLIDQRPS